MTYEESSEAVTEARLMTENDRAVFWHHRRWCTLARWYTIRVVHTSVTGSSVISMPTILYSWSFIKQYDRTTDAMMKDLTSCRTHEVVK